MAVISFALNNNEIAALVQDDVKRDLAQRCNRVKNKAKQLCRVDTGRARNSIEWEIRREGNSYTGRIGSNVEYIKYLNSGTKNRSGDHFLEIALQAAL
jgi:hypothetical protein